MVLFKPFTRTQTIRVGAIQTIHQDSNHTVNLRVVMENGRVAMVNRVMAVGNGRSKGHNPAKIPTKF